MTRSNVSELSAVSTVSATTSATAVAPIAASPPVAFLTLLVFLAFPAGLVAQDGPSADSSRGADAPTAGPTPGSRTLEAVPLRGSEPVLDGRIQEAVWTTGAHATDFVQFRPEEGAAASEPTEAWVLHGPDALWVAFRAHDSAPEEIAGQLTRRDRSSYTDQLIVAVDSYFDRRTAFLFSVNPVGVKTDVHIFDDGQEDASWDPVWDVATEVDDAGWTAEFRIPYSQLRFSGAPVQDWGLGLVRNVARLDEESAWSPISQRRSGIVFQFGVLEGLRGLESPDRLEVEPYVMARVERAPGDPENPFYRSNDLFGSAGADLEYGIMNDLTLNATFNPDFGQVEADPGQVNLTAFETFFPERRPFFLEGRNIFDLSLGGPDGSERSAAASGEPPTSSRPGRPGSRPTTWGSRPGATTGSPADSWATM